MEANPTWTPPFLFSAGSGHLLLATTFIPFSVVPAPLSLLASEAAIFYTAPHLVASNLKGDCLVRSPSINQRRPARALVILCFTVASTVLLAFSIAPPALAQHGGGGSGHGGAAGSHGFGGGGHGGRASIANSKSAHHRFASTFGRLHPKGKFRVCENANACGGEAGYVPCGFWHRHCPPISQAPASNPRSTGPPSSSNPVNSEVLFAALPATDNAPDTDSGEPALSRLY
jgi:hypothetical protein